MTKTDIAVVIVTYKSALLTIESLRSVAGERSEQPGTNIRAIVVDNHSGDAPLIAEAIELNGWHSWVKLVSAAKNGGFAYGNNLGIARAYQDRVPSYIYLLNPDAQVRAGAIRALVQFLEQHPEAGIAGSSFENLDGSDWPIAFHFPSFMTEMIQGIELALVMRLFRRWTVAQHMSKVAQPIEWICGASMLIRPEVIAAIGGLDENYFLYFEETDFCYRAKKAGFATWYVPESRVMHIRGQSTSVTDLTLGPQRLPGYWFESRRRFFVATYGLWHAMAIDFIAFFAGSIGLIKRALLGRLHTTTPHYLRDLVSQSIIWPRNRSVPAIRCSST